MSQGSNYKKQVMEALFNAPTNLITNKAVMWAASNLPDEGGVGKFNTKSEKKVNHEADNVWEALGFKEKDILEARTTIERLYANHMKEGFEKGTNSMKKSEIIEKILTNSNDDAKIYLLVFAISKLHDHLVEEGQKILAEELSEEEKKKYLQKFGGSSDTVGGLESLLKALKKFLDDRKKDDGGEK
jgi:hypothetical protein